MNSADRLLGKMKRKRFMGPQGALVVYLLHLEAVSERSLFWQFVGELSATRVRREKAVVHSGRIRPGNWFAPPDSN
jgi:hypothetical protein